MGSLRVVWPMCLVCLVGCGFRSAVIASGVDAEVVADGAVSGTDAVLDAGDLPTADASLCFEGFTPVCLQALPTTPLIVAVDRTIDTATGCATTTMGTATGICVIAQTSIEVAAGATLRVTGPRPILLLATTSIVIAGTLDAASHTTGSVGPGASPAGPCGSGVPPTFAGGSAGGGYGGTFATIGGDGGDSAGRGAKGTASTARIVPTTLRGGCAGIPGASSASGTAGAGGAGGGAVELLSASIMIAVSGTVNASGAGGLGGANNDSGGGGGGSGGMVVFDTAALTITGSVMAQGGGGGGGGGNAGAGQPGSDPSMAGMAAAPGDGYHGGTGTGGMGGTGAVATDAGDAHDGDRIGGGGGGGATGVTHGPPATGTISPPFS